LKYRAEIDGLRAIAVVPVIFFHAGFELFSGGFVGVDVFFVISGYLITTILIEDIENKKFSIISFYERRMRRILPALILVMLVCIPFSWIWMLPNQVKDFSQSLVAVSLFMSNILFWLEDDYFDNNSEKKPLIHTWSLAVEEQYYIIFPLFLIFAWRLGKDRVFWIIVIIALISLIFSEWCWRKDISTNFFLAPSRAWEIFAGSITAFIVQKRGVIKNNLLSLIGLILIIFSIFIFNEKTPFPSIYTLVPVTGVMFLILFASSDTFVAQILSNRIIVGLGLISYSLYLWHQPLFAFTRIRFSEEPSKIIMMMLTALSFILALLSWRYIEKPFRNKNLVSRFKIIIFFLIFGISIITFGLLAHFYPKKLIPNYGWVKILEGNTGLSDKCDFKKRQIIPKKECVTSLQPMLAIFGDSHAMHLVDGFNDKFRKNYGIIQLTKSGCAPLIKIAQEDNRYEDCVNFNSISLNYLKKNKYIKVVAISSSFNLLAENTSILFNGMRFSDNEKKIQLVTNSLKNLIEELNQSGKSVVLFSTTPLFPKKNLNPGECVLRAKMVNKDLQSCDFVELKRFRNKALIVFDNININGLFKIDLAKQICTSTKCKPYFNNLPIYGKGGHLSRDGAKYLSNKYSWEDLIISIIESKFQNNEIF